MGCSVGVPVAGCVLNISDTVSSALIKVLDVLDAAIWVVSSPVVGVEVDGMIWVVWDVVFSSVDEDVGVVLLPGYHHLLPSSFL